MRLVCARSHSEQTSRECARLRPFPRVDSVERCRLGSRRALSTRLCDCEQTSRIRARLRPFPRVDSVERCRLGSVTASRRVAFALVCARSHESTASSAVVSNAAHACQRRADVGKGVQRSLKGSRLRPFARDGSVDGCRSNAPTVARCERAPRPLHAHARRRGSRTTLPDASALCAPQIGMSDINDPPPPYTTDAPPPYVAQNPAHGAPPPYVAQNPAYGAPATGVSSTSGTAHAVHNGHHRGLARVRRLFRTVERKIRRFFKT
ncbi:hypothetical protein B0H15DRAFT_947466 [Mycena belliarum]|uniref:Uncharacterized protein n=1 Tax=Mycena belliarum TaxID=1033014 RepID=A0AAD6XPD4_9AGAR|nr:hypothetical protein B0H15DRAFT_947466 [Mycena belliae]